MLSFPNNFTKGGENSLKYANRASAAGLGPNESRINIDKIKTVNISLNSSMGQKFMDTDVIAITNNENRIQMGGTTLGDVETERKSLNMYTGNDNTTLSSGGYNDNLYWDNENPFQIPAGILKTVNRYNRIYKTPVNNLLNIGYDNGEDTALQNDSSSYAIEFQGTKTMVVSSIFNPTHMMQVNGLSDNIPVMNLDPDGDWKRSTEVELGDAYSLGVSEDVRSQTFAYNWSTTHTVKNDSPDVRPKRRNQYTSLIDKYMNQENSGITVKWEDEKRDENGDLMRDGQGNIIKDNTKKHQGKVYAQIDYEPFDVSRHSSNTANCTIRELVKLSHGRNSIIGQGRYKYADFLFCKDFGKVSNNHMITLRRFAHPVGDNIFKFSGKKHRNREDYGNNDFQENSSHGTLITWFGTDDNKLDDILKYSVKSTWKEFQSKIKEIDSQEDTEANGLIGMLANSFSPGYNSLVARGMAGTNSIWGHWGSKLIGGTMGRMGLPVAGGATNANSMKQWETMRMSADENRIYTPKNTIQATHKYEGKLELTHEFTLNFSYKLRAFDLMNPKTVMLDLIGNILEVTYNRGHFWGGENRIIGPPRNSQGVRNINAFIDRQWDKLEGFLMGFANGTLDWKGILGSISDMVNSAINAIKGAAQETIKTKGQNIVEVAQKLTGQFVRSGASRAMLGQLKNALGRPAVYCMNSLLDGSPVGLWHVTIGNPKNPIAAFGNLILTNTTIQHSGPLGFDDFPTDIKVSCTLKHGRSRDLSEVARMYTKGTGSFYSAVDKNKMSEFFTVANSATGSRVETNLDNVHISQKFSERFKFLESEVKELKEKRKEAKKRADEEKRKAAEAKANEKKADSGSSGGSGSGSGKAQPPDKKADKYTESQQITGKDGSSKWKSVPDKSDSTGKKRKWELVSEGDGNKDKGSGATGGGGASSKPTDQKPQEGGNAPAGTTSQENNSKSAEDELKEIEEKLAADEKEMKSIKDQAAQMGVDVENPLTLDKAFPLTANEQARFDTEDDYTTGDSEWQKYGHFITSETALRYETMGQDRDIEGRILIDEMG